MHMIQVQYLRTLRGHRERVNVVVCAANHTDAIELVHATDDHECTDIEIESAWPVSSPVVHLHTVAV